MSNTEIFEQELQDIGDNSEYMKMFKRLTKDQQLEELSRMVTEINGSNDGKGGIL